MTAQWGAALMFLGGAAALGLPAPAAPQTMARAPVAQVPGAFMQTARDIRRIGPAMAELWPGYWPADQRAIIYAPGQGALLLARQPPSAEYQPVEQGVWWRPGDLPGARKPFMIDYPLGDGTAMLVFAEGEPEELLSLMFHEQFHGYQRSAFKGAGGGQFVSPAAIPDRVRFAAQAELERRLLVRAIASAGAERRRLIHAYLTLRADRERTVPPEVRRVERQFERYEGTAQYVDRAAVAAARAGGTSVGELVIERLRENLAEKDGPFTTVWIRSRGYSVGAALTHLIRDLDPSGWHRRIQESADGLDQHLAQLSGYGPQDDPASIEAVRSEFSFEQIRRRLEPLIRAAEKNEIKSQADFRALGKVGVTVEIPENPGSSPEESSFGFQAGPGGMVQIGPGDMVIPDPVVAEAGLPGGSMTARGTPILAAGKRYTILLPALPRINGAVPAPGQLELASLRLEGEGLSVTIGRPVSVTIAGTDITIRYAPAAR